jgi:hypothetical protein
MADRLINETDTIVRIPAHEILGVPFAVLPTGLVKYDELTTDDINYYAVVTSPDHTNAGAGGNITCAILSDGLTLGFTDSEEDDEKTLCDPGNSVELTDLNFDDDLTGFRDADKTDATSVFNLWTRLTFAPDVPYLDVHRTDKASDQPFVIGDEIDVFYVWTDLPINVHADGGKQKVQSVAVSKSIALDAYVLSA